MSKPKRCCGSCQFWYKGRCSPRADSVRGLCERFDVKAMADNGTTCTSWKGRKYKRSDSKARVKELVVQ